MKPERVCRIIVACAILHNIAILFKEPNGDDTDEDKQQPALEGYNGRNDGKGIRDHIADTFFNS